MDVQAVLKQLQQQLEQLVAQAQAQPIAVPAAAALAGLLVAIFLFYNVARAAPRTGSVYQGGVRRSTRRVFNNSGGAAGRSPRTALTGLAPCMHCRQHKAPQQYHPESPAPAKTPRAAVSARVTVGASPRRPLASLCSSQLAAIQGFEACSRAGCRCRRLGTSRPLPVACRSCASAPAQHTQLPPPAAPFCHAKLVQKTPKTIKKAAEEKEATTVTPKAATRPRRCGTRRCWHVWAPLARCWAGLEQPWPAGSTAPAVAGCVRAFTLLSWLGRVATGRCVMAAPHAAAAHAACMLRSEHASKCLMPAGRQPRPPPLRSPPP